MVIACSTNPFLTPKHTFSRLLFGIISERTFFAKTKNENYSDFNRSHSHRGGRRHPIRL
jgi:hypothetical protein